MPFGSLAPSPSSSGRERRAGTWSPAMLGLANGVAPGYCLPDDSSDEEARGRSSSARAVLVPGTAGRLVPRVELEKIRSLY